MVVLGRGAVSYERGTPVWSGYLVGASNQTGAWLAQVSSMIMSADESIVKSRERLEAVLSFPIDFVPAPLLTTISGRKKTEHLLLPKVHRGSTFALRRAHSRLLSR